MEIEFYSRILLSICRKHHIHPDDLLKRGIKNATRLYNVLDARREIARVLYFTTDLDIKAIARMIGLKGQGVRLGRGVFNFSNSPITRPPRYKGVIAKVCRDYDIMPSDLHEKKNGRAAKNETLVKARQEIAAILCTNTDMPVETIGRLVGIKGARLGEGAFRIW